MGFYVGYDSDRVAFRGNDTIGIVSHVKKSQPLRVAISRCGVSCHDGKPDLQVRCRPPKARKKKKRPALGRPLLVVDCLEPRQVRSPSAGNRSATGRISLGGIARGTWVVTGASGAGSLSMGDDDAAIRILGQVLDQVVVCHIPLM